MKKEKDRHLIQLTDDLNGKNVFLKDPSQRLKIPTIAEIQARVNNREALLKLIKEAKYDLIAQCRCNECVAALGELNNALQSLTLKMIVESISQHTKAYEHLSQLSKFEILVQAHMHVINVRCNANLQFELPSYIGIRGTIICKFAHGNVDYDIKTQLK